MTDSYAQFRPHWLVTLVSLLAIIGFILLGHWQLQRADEKRQLAQRLEERREQPPLLLNELKSIEAQGMEHRRMLVRGWFLEGRTLFIENRKHRGDTGFHVISPFQVEGGDILAVNRGWVRPGEDRQPPAIASPTEPIQLTGIARIPSPPLLDLSDVALSDVPGSEVWPFFTLARFQQWVDKETYPWALLLDADSPAGFVRRWPQPQTNDQMHIGYALQWFAFAVIVLVIWAKLSFKKQTTRKGHR